MTDSKVGDGAQEPRARGNEPTNSGSEPSSAEATRSNGGDPSDDRPRTAPKPKIGDSRPAPAPAGSGAAGGGGSDGGGGSRRRRRRGGRGRGRGGQNRESQSRDGQNRQGRDRQKDGGQRRDDQGRQKRGKGGRGPSQPVEALTSDVTPVELDEETLSRRRGRERKGKPVGRYLMAVHVQDEAIQIAILEGRNLIEHYVSHPADDVSQIHGNIYIGRVQNVLPGMEAAFVDIGTPKNAVLYRGDVQFDQEDLDNARGRPRIEHVLKARQTILCQVTKNPIAHKGARLTQEVSLPGRFVVLVPNSSTYGISKRLPDSERKRLRKVLDRVKPAQHGIIVRTAAENVTTEEIEADVARLVSQWDQIEVLAEKSTAPALLYREPEMAVRVIREEFNKDYRGVVIDGRELYEQVKEYVSGISPALADRVEFYDERKESLGLFERHHVHDQLLKALDRKVWLPSGGSLIIEQTEALTVIDVNTGKNVGRSSLEETVFNNNIEAAREAARQLRLRDIGGIIVIDFVDMESKRNREETMKVFREALARDKTRTQVYDISELGLVEMTRKRIGEGLVESLSYRCEVCDGRGLNLDNDLVEVL